MASERPRLPESVKRAVMILQRNRCAETGAEFTPEDALEGRIAFDHRPPLVNRERVWTLPPTDPAHYVPDANDPMHIHAVRTDGHDTRTWGPGGESRVTTRGSDLGELRRAEKIAASHAEHKRKVSERKCGERRTPSGSIRGRGSAPGCNSRMRYRQRQTASPPQRLRLARPAFPQKRPRLAIPCVATQPRGRPAQNTAQRTCKALARRRTPRVL